VAQEYLAVSTEKRHFSPLKCSLKWLSRKSNNALIFLQRTHRSKIYLNRRRKLWNRRRTI